MRLVAAFAVLILAATPARAQPSDPIGEILDQAEEPETAPVEAEPEPVAPAAPAPAPRRPQLTAPVNVDEVGKTPDAPPTARDLAYESRLRAAAASAQGFQGPLDGSWTLSGAGGDLYSFKLVDKGQGAVEGAWLDLRRRGAPAASGFIDEVERVGSEMTLRFAGVVVELQGQGDGRWSGGLQEAGQRRTVSLRRSP